MAVANPTNIQFAEYQAALENIWAQPQKNKNYVPRIDSLKMALGQQTATLAPLEDPDTEKDFKVKWVDHAAETPTDLTQNDDCTNTIGSQGLGKTQTYALDYKKSVTFSVERDQLEKSFIPGSEMVAIGLASKTKDLLESFNATIPAVLNTNRGDVVANYVGGTTGWTLDAVGKRITIASANMVSDQVIPQLLLAKRYARFQGGMIHDSSTLFKDYYKGLKTLVNADGKAVNEMYQDAPYCHDVDGMAAASLSDTFFYIDPGTIAIANRAKYPSLATAKWTQGASGSYLRYSMPISLPDLPQMEFVVGQQLKKQSLMLDVQYSVVCSGGKEFDTWKLILRAGVFVNPVRLLTGNTGILKFVKV